MKYLFTCLRISLFLLCATTTLNNSVFAQTYNNPESTVYDPIGEQYFVSNKGGNTITILKNGTLSNFVTSDLRGPKGLLLKGDTLICICNKFVIGFNISTATQNFKYNITGSAFLNDATLASDGYLYITDTSKSIIFKLSLKDGTHTQFINTNLTNPNGILFDKRENRLIFCEWGSNAKIRAINLKTAQITDLVATGVADLDGLAFDNNQYLYFSSWGSNSIYRYDKSFSNEKELVSSNHSGPADISIDLTNNKIAVPNFNSNSVELITIPAEIPTFIKNTNMKNLLIQNPVNNIIKLNYPIENYSLFSLNGKKLITGKQSTTQIPVNHLKKGVYILMEKRGSQYIQHKITKK